MWDSVTWTDFGQFTGMKGDSGTSGIDGTSGTSGTSGLSGSSGTSGINGTNGTSGSSGSSGNSGTSGTSGSSGTSFIWRGTWNSGISYALNNVAYQSGSSYICISAHTSAAASQPGIGGSWNTYWQLQSQAGTSGTSGSSGSSGLSGTSGTSGINGTSGTSGNSGSSGSSGSSGLSGTSGTSGTDGTSGTSPIETYSNTYTAATSWTVAHALQSSTVLVQCWDDSASPQMIIPNSITINSANQVTVDWGVSSVGGRVCVIKLL